MEQVVQRRDARGASFANSNMDGGIKSMKADEIGSDLTFAVSLCRLYCVDMVLMTRGQYGVQKAGMSCTREL
jgi:hypothetical protein